MLLLLCARPPRAARRPPEPRGRAIQTNIKHKLRNKSVFVEQNTYFVLYVYDIALELRTIKYNCRNTSTNITHEIISYHGNTNLLYGTTTEHKMTYYMLV